ncbi:MAG: phosphoribosylformylglycinamidine synthase I [Endomicrobiales bacterium]
MVTQLPRTIIIRTAGTNCDYETQAAFELAGSAAERVHINRIIDGSVRLDDYHILAIPGGFSYGDDIASGKILANELKYRLGDALQKFAMAGKPIIGICNGFQVLVKMGLLPDPVAFQQTTTLTFNDSDKFESRWVYLKQDNDEKKKPNKCLWVRNMPDIIPLPVAHGEGKFVTADKKVLDTLEKNNQVVFRYCDPHGKNAQYPLNPNGAVNAIAAITNSAGNVFGLMPHPERYIFCWQHPNRQCSEGEYGWGLNIFKNAVTITG